MINGDELPAKDILAMKLTWLKKVQKARKMFFEHGFTRRGYNTHHKFHYATIDDILLVAIPILEEVGLVTWYNMSQKSMMVIDIDTAYYDTLYLEDTLMQYGEGKTDYINNTRLQDVGKKQTYYRKYLYMQLFDIADNDEVDGFTGTPQAKQENTSTKQQLPHNTTHNKHQNNANNAEWIPIIDKMLQEENREKTNKNRFRKATELWQQGDMTVTEYRNIREEVM